MEDVKDDIKNTTAADEEREASPTLEVCLNPNGGSAADLLVGAEVGEALEGTELEKLVDADLRRFNSFFKKHLNNADGMSGYERAAIKTFLWWKTHPQEKSVG